MIMCIIISGSIIISVIIMRRGAPDLVMVEMDAERLGKATIADSIIIQLL